MARTLKLAGIVSFHFTPSGMDFPLSLNIIMAGSFPPVAEAQRATVKTFEFPVVFKCMLQDPNFSIVRWCGMSNLTIVLSILKIMDLSHEC